MFTVVDQASLQAAKRQGTHLRTAHYQVNGEMRSVNYRLENGRVIIPAGEVGSLGSLSGLSNIEQLTGRMALDVEIGREQVNLLYKPIYDPITDPNFPSVVEGKWAMRGVVVFLQIMELEEIKYGHFEAEQGPGATINTFAAMLPVTRQMIDFNQGWNVSEVSRSFGEAYNALLNHVHLWPILNATYAAGNQTAHQAGAQGDPSWVGVYKTLAAGLKAADQAKRTANTLLVSRIYRQDVEMAIRGGHQLNGTIYPPLPIDTVIYYDGWTISWNKKTVTYAGCGNDYGYLIRTKRGFKELIKRDLVTEKVTGDPSRMIDDVWRGYCYRGVYAAVAENVQRVDLSA
jgi:hypothetical protein